MAVEVDEDEEEAWDWGCWGCGWGCSCCTLLSVDDAANMLLNVVVAVLVVVDAVWAGRRMGCGPLLLLLL